MKKSFIFFLFAGVFTLSAFSQNWVTLTQREPAAPEITLNRSNNSEVNFTVGLPGFFSTPITENGTNYQRISIQGYGTTGATGEPEIPVITHRIAVPECTGGITYSVSITAFQTLSGYMLYPVPDYQPNSEGMWEEVFTVNPLAYLPNAFTPGSDYAEAETGAFRNQKFVTLHIHPFQFNPATGDLQVATEMEVTLTFNQPITDVNAHLGPFSKSAAATFLNYEGSGNGFMQYDKAYEKAGFVPGKVKWITITNPAQADTISCDYLIVTVDDFFTPHNADLQRLAEHRAWYNGYDVAIVNVADILDDNVGFDYENYPLPDYKREQRLRTFIRMVYEGNIDPVTGFSKLLFVLLVGDNYNNNTAGMPTSFDHNMTSSTQGKYATDYYFTCVTKEGGMYDPVGDLNIGRFSVEDGDQLYNMVHKTINHETYVSEDESWRKKAVHIYGWSYGFGTQSYENAVSNLLDEIEWENYIVDIEQIKEPTLNYWNEGTVYSFYTCPGFNFLPTTWEDNLNVSAIESELHNEHKNPFIFCHAHRSGWFDDMNCFAEFITRYDSIKGAVGYIGASRPAGSVWGNFNPIKLLFHEAIPNFLFNKCDTNHTPIAGELLRSAKTLSDQSSNNNLIAKYAYNLFGDPALNILAEPTCNRIVFNQEQLLNGQKITIPDDCILYFEPQGKLIIEEGGALELGNRVQVIGVNNAIDTVIHIKGGGLIVGEDVVFQDLPGGILLENAQSELNPSFFDENIAYNLKGITFFNTPIMHRGTPLIVSNCTFNEESDIITSAGWASIDSCIFNNATFMSVNAVPITIYKDYTRVTYSQFNGNSSNTAVNIIGSDWYVVAKNSISGYETGVSVSESGISQSSSSSQKPYIPSDRIALNSISNCDVGVSLYNSAACISGNIISNNYFGIRLYNNSYTIFDFYENTNQYIQDNDSYELYASANSFPTVFRYNHVIDDDNLGSSLGDPLIFWEVDTNTNKLKADVRYNCWGKNINPLENFYPSKVFIWNPEWCGKSGTPTRGDDEILYLAGLEFFSNEDYSTAEATFKEVIETYPESHFAIAALHELFALEHYTNQDFYNLYSYYTLFTPADSNLFHTADFLATRCHVKEKNWQPAVDWYENRIENPPSYQDSIFAVIDLGALHLMMEGDTVSGTKGSYCYYRLAEIKPKSKQEYEENKATLLATLPQINKSQIPNLKPQTAGALGQCIPNPTNGNATISYELYTEGSVEIQVFNTMGQLVKSFPQGTLKQGNYQAKVSLSGFPAGLYHYSLLVNGEKTDAKKLVVN